MNCVRLTLLVEATLLIVSASAVAQETPAPPAAERVHLTDAARRPLSNEWFGVFANSVLRSDDDGVTWAAKKIDSSGAPASCTAFRSIAFVDSLNAWIAGDCQTVYRSMDGGETWKVVSAGSANRPAFVRLVFYDVTSGVAADATGQLLLTSDEGRTWESFLEAEDAGEVFVASMGRTSMHGVSTLEGEWKIGVNGYSEFGDGDSTGVLKGTLPKIGRDFVARGAVLLSGWGWVVPESRDKICWVKLGNSWTWITRPVQGLRPGEKIVDATFADGGSGWLAGDRGTLLRTEDSGRTWKKVATVKISRFLDMIHGSKHVVLNDRGEVIYADVFTETPWIPAVLSKE